MFDARLNRREAVLLENHDLHDALKSCKGEIKALTPQTRNYPVRIIVVAMAALLITVIVCQSYGLSLKDLPGKIKQLMHTQVTWKTGVILGSVGLLLGGTTFIIYRVTRGKGKFWGDSHYKPVVLKQSRIPGKERIHWDSKMQPHRQLVDTSLLEDGTGTTNAVERKGGEHDLISFTTLVVAPIQTVCAVAYNAIRFCIIPFYILGRMAQEAYTDKPACGSDHKFKLIDIPKQMGLSLYWAARAPFYGIAYTIATLYSFIDPMGGRKLGQLVTNEWMEGIDRLNSVWTCEKVDGYKWEGGGGADQLGKQAYFWTGCWMPWATVEMDKGAITRAYYPGDLFEYDVYFPGEHKYQVPDLCKLPDLFEGKPEDVARALPVGHYRVVFDDTPVAGPIITLVAHVTKGSGERMRFVRKVAEVPEDVDAFLNACVNKDDGIIETDPATTLFRVREENKTIESEKPLNTLMPTKAGHYLYVRQDENLYRISHDQIEPLNKPIQGMREELASKDVATEGQAMVLAYDLERGKWREVKIGQRVYIIAHIQNEWGEDLYIRKKVLSGENPEYTRPYLKKCLQNRDKKEYDLLGFETVESVIRRTSLKVVTKELQ